MNSMMVRRVVIKFSFLILLLSGFSPGSVRGMGFSFFNSFRLPKKEVTKQINSGRQSVISFKRAHAKLIRNLSTEEGMIFSNYTVLSILDNYLSVIRLNALPDISFRPFVHLTIPDRENCGSEVVPIS
jgi:hypothetical protein